VWDAFPGQPDRKRDFLTRLDRQKQGFGLLIVSSDLPACPPWCSARETWQTKEIPESYFTVDHYLFQLCANPTKKLKTTLEDGTRSKNGRRIPLTSRNELMDWMRRKAEQGGFAVNVDTLQAVPKGREYFSRHGQLGLHSAVEFRGMLRVLDKERFRESFTRGIGSAKAFGFGLLLLKRLRTFEAA
jgi:CRISPR system Cascade subunit CasE